MSADPSGMKDDKGGAAAAEQAVKCPRCDSPNTKFCYYNNYSLTQPRHFCKTCRRYWTKGGALRNVPIGGGCRKNKKVRSSSSDLGPLKFFSSPAMDFQLSRAQPQYSGTGHYQFSSPGTGIGGYGLEMSYAPPNQEMNNNKATSSSSLASSIESLSCINQDLHWKLQQQRLAMLLGTTADNLDHNQNQNQHHQQKQDLMTMQPILFQNLELSRKEAAGDVATEWFFGNSYANQTTTDGARTGGSWSTGAGWTDLQQQQQQNHYTALP